MTKAKTKTKTKKRTQKVSCDQCTGLCCRYFALPLENPEDWDDFDDIRWYLAHENVTVFVEDGEWYINVNNVCRHLDSDYRCDHYCMRPKICRDYTMDGCDLTGDDYGYELHFTDDKQMEEYMQIKFGKKVFDKLEKKPKAKKKRSKKK